MWSDMAVLVVTVGLVFLVASILIALTDVWLAGYLKQHEKGERYERYER